MYCPTLPLTFIISSTKPSKRLEGRTGCAKTQDEYSNPAPNMAVREAYSGAPNSAIRDKPLPQIHATRLQTEPPSETNHPERRATANARPQSIFPGSMDQAYTPAMMCQGDNRLHFCLTTPCSGFTRVRPARSLNRPRRPLSQGFGPAGYPTRPPVSYQIKPTTVWVDPSSTGVTRRRGALRSPGKLTIAFAAMPMCSLPRPAGP